MSAIICVRSAVGACKELPDGTKQDVYADVGDATEDCSCSTREGSCGSPASIPSRCCSSDTFAGSAQSSSATTPPTPPTPLLPTAKERSVLLLPLLASFVELCGQSASTCDLDCRRQVLRVMDMLYRCGYALEDILTISAHASAYFADAIASEALSDISLDRLGQIMVSCMYIAHSYVVDEPCVLHHWRSAGFGESCSTKALDLVVASILRSRGYRLRLQDHDLCKRLKHLERCTSTAPSPGRRGAGMTWLSWVCRFFCECESSNASTSQRGSSTSSD